MKESIKIVCFSLKKKHSSFPLAEHKIFFNEEKPFENINMLGHFALYLSGKRMQKSTSLQPIFTTCLGSTMQTKIPKGKISRVTQNSKQNRRTGKLQNPKIGFINIQCLTFAKYTGTLIICSMGASLQ